MKADKKFLEKLAKGSISLGKYLESIRLGEEETLAQFAKRLGISRSHLNDIEKGNKAVSPARAGDFAKKLGHHEGYFVMLAARDLLKKEGVEKYVKIQAA